MLGCVNVLAVLSLSISAAATPETGSRVTFREDQTILVNGKPFFPIGIYYAFEEMDDPTGQGLEKLKSMGFNTLFIIDRDRPVYDRIAAHGFHVWCRPPGALHDSHEILRKFITEFRNHPAILFWEHDDEPVLNRGQIDKSREGYRLVKQLDPNHPVLCTQAPNPSQVAAFLQWAEISDVGAFDVYPVPLQKWDAGWYGKGRVVDDPWPNSMAVMGRMTRQWQSWGGGKPVIVVVQGFSWDPLLYTRDGFPNYEQGRFMAYDCVINGAKGLHYFGRVAHEPPPTTTAPAGNPEAAKVMRDYQKIQALNDWFWSYHAGVIRELAVMSPVFTSLDAAWKPLVEAADAQTQIEAVEWRVKQMAGDAVILLVNGSERPAKLKITAQPLAGRDVHCWGELRTIKIDDNGTWFDRVGPLGVRIYSTAAPPTGIE